MAFRDLATADLKDLHVSRGKRFVPFLAVLADLVALAGNRNALIAGRKLTLTQKDGAVSYAKAIKALCPGADLEPYRGKPSEFWGVR